MNADITNVEAKQVLKKNRIEYELSWAHVYRNVFPVGIFKCHW